MVVNISHLTKIYNTQRAIDNISFEASKGQILGLLGPNGAGKSTTMKILTCYIPPTSGTAAIAGFDVVQSPIEVRKRVGYLPEHNPLYLDMYVHEYLRFIGSIHQISGSILNQKVKNLIALTGLTVEQNKKIGVLSKGYRQRVGLAQAMIHDPEVLILDEPTTGLDPNQIIEIRNLIKELGKEKTIILSTHIMQEVQAICDKVVIMNKGKIVANGDLEQIKLTHKSARVITVEFEQEIDTSAITNLSGVKSVVKNSNFQYDIYCDDIDLRSQIFNLSNQHNWKLLGLTQKENTVEDVFSELTKN